MTLERLGKKALLKSIVRKHPPSKGSTIGTSTPTLHTEAYNGCTQANAKKMQERNVKQVYPVFHSNNVGEGAGDLI